MKQSRESAGRQLDPQVWGPGVMGYFEILNLISIFLLWCFLLQVAYNPHLRKRKKEGKEISHVTRARGRQTKVGWLGSSMMSSRAQAVAMVPLSLPPWRGALSLDGSPHRLNGYQKPRGGASAFTPSGGTRNTSSQVWDISPFLWAVWPRSLEWPLLEHSQLPGERPQLSWANCLLGNRQQEPTATSIANTARDPHHTQAHIHSHSSFFV